MKTGLRILRRREKQGKELAYQVVNDWIEDLRIYIKVKALVSLVTGILFGGLCYLFGVDFALFFGFLAFCVKFHTACWVSCCNCISRCY